jgi:hypothetical protein
MMPGACGKPSIFPQACTGFPELFPQVKLFGFIELDKKNPCLDPHFETTLRLFQETRKWRGYSDEWQGAGSLIPRQGNRGKGVDDRQSHAG